MTKNLHKKIALQVYASGEDDLFGKGCKRGGTCYEDAGQFILRKASPSDILVHGRPTLQVPPHIEYGHAWIERGNEIIDPSTGFKGPKVLYYALGNIKERDNLKYTTEEARQFLVAYGHYGPWEGPEGVGPDPQMKKDWLQTHDSLPSRSKFSRLAQKIASRVPPGFDSKVWEDTKARVLERTRREFVWLGWGHADWGTPIEREALQELSYEGKVEFHIGKGYIATDSFLARNAKSDIPKTVKRYVDEHLEQGNDEEKSWALAWSRYCQYKYPNSPHCKKDEYFEGKKSHYHKEAKRIIWTDQDFDPWEFAKDIGIRPDSTKEFYAAIEDDHQNVVAVLFTGYSRDCFSFDIAVDPDHQKKGYGSTLMDLAIDYYEDLLEPFPDLKFCLDAVNPVAVKMLLQRDFEITDQRGGHTYMTKESQRLSSSFAKIAKKITEEAARKLVEEYSEELADMEREITVRFKRNEKGTNTEVEVEDSEGEDFSVIPIPVSLATFAREMDYWTAPEDEVTDIERHITKMEGKEYKEAARKVASRFRRKQAINIDYFDQRHEVPWKFMEEDPYDHAMMAIRIPLARWTEFPSRSLKEEIVDTWKNLHPELKEALDKANRKAMGSSSVMWRVESSGNFPTDFGGYSMHDTLEKGRVPNFLRNLYDVRKDVPINQSEYKDPSEWEVEESLRGYKVNVDDVLIHYGVPRNPIGEGRWKSEKEIILKPGAKPKPLSEKEMIKNLMKYLNI